MSDPVLIHRAAAAAAGLRYHVDPADILGILSVEGGTSSTGQPVAPGDGAGPASYGQFTYETGKALGVKFGNSVSEVNAIAKYLNDLGYQKDRKKALAAYNGGPGNPQYDYADKVITASQKYGGKGDDKGGSPITNILGVGGVAGALGASGTNIVDALNPTTALATALKPFEWVGNFFELLLSRDTYFRLLKGAGGAIFVVLGTGTIIFYFAKQTGLNPVGTGSTKVSPMGAVKAVVKTVK